MIIGTAGTGKDITALHDLLNERVGKQAIIYNAPKGEDADEFADVLYSRYPNVAVDPLTRNDMVLPCQLLGASDHADPQIREEQNAAYRDAFLDFAEGALDGTWEQHPLLRFLVEDTCKFWQALPPDRRSRIPFHTMDWLYVTKSRQYRQLLAVQPNWDASDTFRRFATLHASTQMQVMDSARRLLQRVAGSPAMKSRDLGESLPWPEIIRDKWIVITQGGPGVSRYATQAVMRARTASLIQYLENRGAGPPVVVFYGEFVNFGTLANIDVRALQLDRSRGYEGWLSTQRFPDDPVMRRAVIQNTATKVFHACYDRDEAEIAAACLLGELNPYLEHHRTSRQVHDGYDLVTAAGWSEDSEGERRWQLRDTYQSRYKDIEDVHYTTLSDQATLLAKRIQNLKVGERVVKRGNEITWEKVPLVQPLAPWGLR